MMNSSLPVDEESNHGADLSQEQQQQPLLSSAGGASSGSEAARFWQQPRFRCCLAVLLVVTACGLVLALALVFGLSAAATAPPRHPPSCLPNTVTPQVSFAVVESIPLGVNLSWPPDYPQPASVPVYNHSTAAAWHQLIEQSQQSIDILCFYMTLNATDDGSVVDDSPPAMLLDGHAEGVAIYQDLIDAARRGVAIRIVTSYPTTTVNSPSLDIQRLVAAGYAQARVLNMTQLWGNGVMHSKLMIFDQTSLYTGSANLDWRALTQVKELGVVLTSSCLVADMQRQFEFYWAVAARSEFPPHSQSSTSSPYTAFFNAPRPALVPFASLDPSAAPASVFFTSSPAPFCPPQRSVDLTTILDLIGGATTSVCLSVMDYIPATMYSNPNYYWPDIDDALRSAAFDGVQVRLMFAIWNYTNPIEIPYWQSLATLGNIQVRYILLPPQPDVPPVPFTRVDHCKFLLVDNQHVLVSTSNWSADYFIDTTGVSAVSNDTVMVGQIQAVFDRDWNSPYTFPLSSLPDLSQASP